MGARWRTRWGAVCLVEGGDQRHIAIDGKTMRASKDGDGNATHVLSAFCAGLQSILGNEASRGKGMEIPDALKLLDRLDLKGRIVTGDAMFCQKSIVAKIVEKGGDYVLPVKDNQKNLRENIQTAFDEPVFPLVSFGSDCEKTHGRIERRSIDVLPARAAGIEKDWPSVQHICTICMDGIWMAAEEIARGRLDKANADCSSAAQRMKSAKLWWGRLKPGGGMDFGSLLTWGMR